VRYVNGNPKYVYVLTFQKDGSMSVFTSLSKVRKAKVNAALLGYTVTVGTYDLRRPK